MIRVLFQLCLCLILTPYLLACTSEQVKRSTYHSIHEKQRQDCINEGRTDCSQYDYESYDEYQRKRED